MLPLLLSLAALAQDADPTDTPAPAEASETTEASDDSAPSDESAEPAEPAEPEWNLPDFPGQITPDTSPHWELEVLYHQGEFDKGLIKTKALMRVNPNDKDLYWLAGRFQFEIGELIPRDDTSIDKEAFYKEMLDYAEKGLLVAPNDPHLLYLKGIALGRYGTTRGVLSTLFLASDVEASWLAVEKANFEYRSIDGEEWLPCDVYLCLSIFYRLVPDSWLVQAIAGTRGSMSKSMSYIERANRCSQNSTIGTIKELGVVQLCQGTKDNDSAMIEKGKSTLNYMLSLSPKTKTERTDHRHAKMLLATPGLACGYSRDGQQDLDEGQLEQ